MILTASVVYQIEILRARRLPRATAILKGGTNEQFLDFISTIGSTITPPPLVTVGSSPSCPSKSTSTNYIAIKDKKNIVAAATQIAKRLLLPIGNLPGNSGNTSTNSGTATSTATKDNENIANGNADTIDTATNLTNIIDANKSITNTGTTSLPQISTDAVPFVNHLVSLVDDKLQAKTHISQVR